MAADSLRSTCSRGVLAGEGLLAQADDDEKDTQNLHKQKVARGSTFLCAQCYDKLNGCSVWVARGSTLFSGIQHIIDGEDQNHGCSMPRTLSGWYFWTCKRTAAV